MAKANLEHAILKHCPQPLINLAKFLEFGLVFVFPQNSSDVLPEEEPPLLFQSTLQIKFW